jgi:hypothetical protein
MKLDPIYAEDVCYSVETTTQLYTKGNTKLELREPRLCTIREHLTNLHHNQTKSLNPDSIFGCSLDSPNLKTLAYFEPLYIFKMDDLVVSSNYSHLYLPSKNTIAEKFGTKRTFRKNMSEWGSYFGYSAYTGKFDVSKHIAYDPSTFVPKTKILTDDIAPILISNDANDKCLTHWIFGGARNAYYAGKIYHELTNPILLFSYQPSSWQLQLLELMLGDIKFKYAVLNGATQFHSLLFFNHQDESVLDGDYLSYLQSKGRERKSNDYPKKIFISREDAQTRRISNFDVIEPILVREGYQSITMTEHSIPEQISLVASADVILFIDGSHGALLTFANSKAKVGLLRSELVDSTFGFWHWERLPVNFGLESPLKYIATTTDQTPTPNSNLLIEPNAFSNYLKHLENR